MSKIDNVLRFFEKINEIPRKSRNTGPITQFLMQWAREQGFEAEKDETANVLIRVPASPGYENSPVVILQGHSDMVCEKTPDSDHDFSRDPVKCLIEGEWMRGDNTSLGADNGIALALAMDIATDPLVKHPPLEILVTSDEEIGLIGANNLKEGFLSGKILINMDSEDEGVFTIGCAGGADSKIAIPLSLEKVPGDYSFYRITIGGLLGGHSGMDIALNRGNALKMAGRILSDLSLQTDLRLVSLNGGSGASNAICRDASTVIAFPQGEGEKIRALVEQWASVLKDEIKTTEPDLTVSLKEAAAQDSSLDAASRNMVLQVLRLIPHGIEKFSSDIENLVETSSNLAWMSIEKESLHILTSQRSSVMSELRDMNLRMEDLAALAGGSCETLNKYPSWQPDMDSPLLKKSADLYRTLMGREPVIEAIHAGLECGLIGDKYPGMDMISIGPTIKHPHTPEERLHVASLEPFRDFLAALLGELKG